MNEKKFQLMYDTLCVFGDENIREHHISFFESKLIELNEHHLKDLSLAPNYYAWICLSVEHIFWIIKGFCFKQSEFKNENLMLLYNDLVVKFFEICDEQELVREAERERLYLSIMIILDIRHAIVHKGFPNLLKAANLEEFKRTKPKSKKSSPKQWFTEEETRKIIEKYSSPNNFCEINEQIKSIRNIIRKAKTKPIAF